MSVLRGLTAEFIFGPPAPISKDTTLKADSVNSTENKTSTSSKQASDMRLGRRAKKEVLTDKTNVSNESSTMPLSHSQCALPSSTEPLPGPTGPSVGMAETILSSGASMLSALGSLLSSAGPGVPPAESAPADDATPTPSTITQRPVVEQSSSLLDSVSALISDQAIGVCNVTVSSVKQAATSCTNSVLSTVGGTSKAAPSPTTPLERPSSPTPSTSSFSSTVSYIPPQYTSTGELFSSDPSVAAMQRIPDHSCGHKLGSADKVLHCCSLPPGTASPTRSMSIDSASSIPGCSTPKSLSRTSSFASIECSCDCFKSSSTVSLPAGPSQADAKGKSSTCDCVCHDHHRYRRGQSGHFHRVEQIVRGTKRVVRDIKNVL